MKRTNRKDKRTELEKEIDKLLEGLKKVPYDSEDYGTRLKVIERLSALKEDKTKKRVSGDTWAIVGAQLLGMIILVCHEELGHVITSKAFSWIVKGRV